MVTEPNRVGSSAAQATPAYDRGTRLLHWLAAALVLIAWELMQLIDSFPDGSDQQALVALLHFHCGLLVLFLLVPRLPWRWLHPVAPIDAVVWRRRLATLAKASLYVLMLVVPLSGMATLQSKGEAVAFLGLPLPDLFSGLAPWREAVRDLHETLSNALLLLGVAHAAAALWHHFVMRDATLRRMLGRG